MTNPDATFTLRRDLIHQQIEVGSRLMWVIKDPVSSIMSYFDADEYALLCLADGRRTDAALVAEAQQLIAPNKISMQAIQRFFESAHASGLVLMDGATAQTESLRNRRRWWANPLAIRVPGINPDRMLTRIVPANLGKYLIPLVIGLIGFWALGAMIGLSYLDELSADFSSATSRILAGQDVLVFLMVIGTTKIIHEFAHAVTCKTFGGEVSEMGFMFLVGAPCLYCDVSDAWLLRKPWKRILVSAAGILAEWTIAAVAAVLWLCTSDIAVREVCVVVMMVCSVSTFMINGNPLLRYDGYFILSDMVGIPNLAAEASAQVRRWLRRILWGERSLPSTRQTTFIGGYGIASGCYRVLLYSVIAWMFYDLAKSLNVDKVFAITILAVFGTMAWRLGRTIFHRPLDRSGRLPRRPAIVGTMAALIAFIIGSIPFPRYVVGPLIVQPAGQQSVFVTRPGRIIHSTAFSNIVRTGDVIATLDSPETRHELLVERTERDRLRVQLEGMRRRRTKDVDLSASIASVETALEAADQRVEQLEENLSELSLKSPCAGSVFAVRDRTSDLSLVTTADYQPQFWHGAPLDPTNRGAFLEPGTEVCVIGDPVVREATVLVDQRDIERLGTGDAVSIRFSDHARDQIRGTVVSIASSPAQQLAEEFGMDRALRPSDAACYQVRLRLDDQAHGIPIRTRGTAKIRVANESLWSRIAQLWAATFG